MPRQHNITNAEESIRMMKKLTTILTILEKDWSKKDKIIMSFGELSGLDLGLLSSMQKNSIQKHVIFANSILRQYPIKTFDDYALISDDHLNKLLKSIKRLCVSLCGD